MQAAWEKLHTGCWKDVDPAWRNAYSLACLLRALVMLSGACAALPAESPRLCSGAALSSQRSLSVSSQGAPQEDAECAGLRAGMSSQPEGNSEQPAGSSTAQHQGAPCTGCVDCIGMPAGALLSAAACGPAGPPASVHACSSDKQMLHGLAAKSQLRPDGGSSGGSEAGAIEAAMRELDMGLMMGGAALAGSLHAAMGIAEDAWSWNASSFPPRISHCRQPEQSSRNGRLHHNQLQQDSKRKREEPEGGTGGSLDHVVTSSKACSDQHCSRKAPARCSQDEWRSTAVWPHDESKFEQERLLSVPPGAKGCPAAINNILSASVTPQKGNQHPENFWRLAFLALCISAGVILQVPGRACVCGTSACHLWTAS